jgi:hypothetical protein
MASHMCSGLTNILIRFDVARRDTEMGLGALR